MKKIIDNELKEKQDLLNIYIAWLAFELWGVLWKYEFLLLQSLQEEDEENQGQLFDEIEFFMRWQEADLHNFISERILAPSIIVEDPAGGFWVWDGSIFISVKRPRSGKYLTTPHTVICPVCRRVRPLPRKHFFREPFYSTRVKGSKTPLKMFEKLYLKPCDDGPCKSEYKKILQSVKKSRVCLQCGKPLPENAAPKKKFCSDTCRVRHYRAKEYVKKLNE